MDFLFASIGILIIFHTLCFVLTFCWGNMESSSYSMNSKRLFTEKYCLSPLQKHGVSMNGHTVWLFSFYRFSIDTFYAKNMQFPHLGLLQWSVSRAKHVYEDLNIIQRISLSQLNSQTNTQWTLFFFFLRLSVGVVLMRNWFCCFFVWH